jgi:hypothetical protein
VEIDDVTDHEPVVPGARLQADGVVKRQGLMSEGSQTCATGSQAGMTTWPSVSQQTLPTMKFQMTSDHHARHEALFVS